MNNMKKDVDNDTVKNDVFVKEMSKIAHEIKNCLTSVHGYAQLIIREIDNTFPFYDELKIIEKECKHCNQLIRQYLDYTVSKIELEFSLIDMHQIIEDSLVLVYPQVKTKRVNIIKEYTTILPQIKGDYRQLKQVITNIFSNALDAINDSGHLHIKTQHAENEVVLKIKDSGSGIEEKHLSRIFEPFFTTKPIGEGTGLGLSVAYSIIKQHNGNIRVESELGSGTIFYIYFPVFVNESEKNKKM